MITAACKQAERETVLQSDCPLWFELRHARVTASKAYDAMDCRTMEGTLVESLLGARKIQTAAMTRGSLLEASVLKEVEKKCNVKLSRCGLLILPEHSIIAASPDAICEDFIVEVKCPTSERAMSRYIKNDKEISAKYMAQIQMQMHLFRKPKALFCVLKL